MNIVTDRNPLGWHAIDQDSYDGAPDSGWPSSAIGYGDTEQEAIDDLCDALELPCSYVANGDMPDRLEMDLVLTEIDPGWHDKFNCPRIAWDFYWPLNHPEMQLALSHIRHEDRETAFNPSLPAFLRRQAD